MSSTTAPAGLALIQSLANTLEITPYRDELLEEDSAIEWLSSEGLPTDLTAADITELRAFRSVVRGLLLANDGHGEANWGDLELYAGRGLLKLGTGPELRLEPAAGGFEGVIATVLASIYQAVCDGTWGRLKICKADTCAWAFYDRSKNGSGTWCSMRVCGNRMKAQRRRTRERSDQSAQT